MIERSSNVNRAYQSQSYQNQSRQNQPYQMQSYDNGGREATDNKHEELAKDVIWEREENLSFPTLETTKEEVTKEQVSFKNIFTSGLRGVIAKAVGFWNDDDSNNKDNLYEKENASEESTVIATALLEPEEASAKENLPEKEHIERVSDIEGIVSGEMEKEPGSGKRLFQRLGEIIYSVTNNWRRPEKPGGSSPMNTKDAERGNRNYLLDSYNKSGQYSTLAKDSSAEGKFKAKV